MAMPSPAPAPPGETILRWEEVDALLPQTQCTRCGEPDCASYARAITNAHTPINRCPPGGAQGIQRLAQLTGQAVQPLDALHGVEGPRMLAVIDEAWCIGCTLCIKACPVDCIVGAAKQMHTVLEEHCTGCERCLPACPVDCITLLPASSPRTGWEAWSDVQADNARERYKFHRRRVERERLENGKRLARKAAEKLQDLEAQTHAIDDADLNRKRRVVQAALDRARARRETQQTP